MKKERVFEAERMQRKEVRATHLSLDTSSEGLCVCSLQSPQGARGEVDSKGHFLWGLSS